MDPLFRPNLRSGNHLGSDDGKLISGDVPDQIRRVGAKAKPIANTIDADPDFSQSIEVGNLTLTLSTRATRALVRRIRTSTLVLIR